MVKTNAGVAQRQCSGIVNRRLQVQIPSPAPSKNPLLSEDKGDFLMMFAYCNCIISKPSDNP